MNCDFVTCDNACFFCLLVDKAVCRNVLDPKPHITGQRGSPYAYSIFHQHHFLWLTRAKMSTDLFVRKITHLKNKPREKEALAYLQRVASLVKPIMRKHNWTLPVLAEFFPTDPGLLGISLFNVMGPLASNVWVICFLRCQ